MGHEQMQRRRRDNFVHNNDYHWYKSGRGRENSGGGGLISFYFSLEKMGIQLKISYNYIHKITALIIMHIGMQVKVYS